MLKLMKVCRSSIYEYTGCFGTIADELRRKMVSVHEAGSVIQAHPGKKALSNTDLSQMS